MSGQNMLELIVDICGWCGAVLLLLAYALLSAQRLEARSTAYQVMNILGSACLLLNAGYHQAFPSAFVNFIWILIAFAALAHHLRTRRAIAKPVETPITPAGGTSEPGL